MLNFTIVRYDSAEHDSSRFRLSYQAISCRAFFLEISDNDLYSFKKTKRLERSLFVRLSALIFMTMQTPRSMNTEKECKEVNN